MTDPHTETAAASMSSAASARPGRGAVTRLHAAAGMAAMLVIAAFWSATVLSELFGTWAQVAQVKTAIAWALLALVPLLATTGVTGARLAGRRPGGLAARKLARMKAVGATGVLVLVPAALYLARAANGLPAPDTAFVAVQGVELVAGFGNLVLMAWNARDGLRMTGRIGRA